MADIVTFKLKGGRWVYPKDPDDQEFYGLDCTDFLAELGAGVTLSSVATGAPADPVALLTDGLTQMIAPRIQGNWLVVKLTGLDPDPDAENRCTFRFYTSTGERFDRSIYFTPKDK